MWILSRCSEVPALPAAHVDVFVATLARENVYARDRSQHIGHDLRAPFLDLGLIDEVSETLCQPAVEILFLPRGEHPLGHHAHRIERNAEIRELDLRCPRRSQHRDVQRSR
jgi:hypothetical protein